MVGTHAKHLIVEYHGCDSHTLNSLELLEEGLQHAAKAARTHIVASVFHPFTPQGVSGVVVIEESHLSIHTWPEEGYAAVDFYTCGDGDPLMAHAVLLDVLKPTRTEHLMLKRGLAQTPSIQTQEHVTHTLSDSNQPQNHQQDTTEASI